MAETPAYDADPGHAAETPLIFGGVLDGEGGYRPVDWEYVAGWKAGAGEGTLWLHLDRSHDAAAEWLEQALDVPDALVTLLTSDETRPRAFVSGDRLLAIMRGINFNPGAEPEDMIALQFWLQPGLVVTLRHERLQSPRDVLARLEAGEGPRTCDELLAQMIELMVEKIGLAIFDMNDRIDALEAAEDTTEAEPMLKEISDIRRDCLSLRRYMSPEHDALLEIVRTAPAWMGENSKLEIRETADRLKRFLEDLEVSIESAIVLQDDINSRLAAQASHTMYMLSIVAAIFLPLSFVTGLLGINVGGMPGVDSTDAFWVTVGLLAMLLGLQLYIFRKLKWL